MNGEDLEPVDGGMVVVAVVVFSFVCAVLSVLSWMVWMVMR